MARRVRATPSPRAEFLESSDMMDAEIFPAGILATLRSMSVSDGDSPVSRPAPLTVPNVVKHTAEVIGGTKSLKQLKQAKRAAKRARDAAPDDVSLRERYQKAKKRYKEMKKLAAQTDTNNMNRVEPPSSLQQFLANDDESSSLNVVREQQQHVQQAHRSQQAQHGQQQDFSAMSPRVAAAVQASRRRRESSTLLDRMSATCAGQDIGANGISNAFVAKSPAAKRRVRFADQVSSTATKSPLERGSKTSSGKSLVSTSSGKRMTNSGKGAKSSPQKVTSLNSVLENKPIPVMPTPANSGKKSKTQQHKDYAAGTSFHPEWYARREEWLSEYSNEGTIRKYRPYVNKLIDYIEQQGKAHLHPGQSISRTLINDFQKLIKTNETANNQTMILSAVSSFLKHLAEEDVTIKDRSKSIKIPAQPKPKKKKNLTLEQVKTIMNAADNDKARALLAAAYFAGLRTKETVHLTAQNCKVVDGNMTIKVTKESAKGKKERDVPIAKSGAILLQPFIDAAKARGGQQYLFPGRFKGTHIVEKTMWNYIKKPARAVGLEDVAAHHFRHAYASHAAQNHVDIATIKDQMGHSSLETTSKYVHGKKDHASSVSVSLEKAFTADDSEPPPPVQKASGGATNELVQLVGMYKEGLLTKDEFNAAKKNLKLLQ